MQPADRIVKEHNMLALLKHVLTLSNINVTHPSILKRIHQHVSPGKNIIQGICSILNGWGIDARYLPLGIEMLAEVPPLSLVFLGKNQVDELQGRFVILLGQHDSCVEFVDPETGPFFMEQAEVRAQWSNIVIALDTEDALDEKDYEEKQIVQQRAIDEAGGVSVIMPVYNQKAFITRALVSLQGQTCQTWELILIDDGSKDNLGDTLAPFLKDDRIRYMKNSRNEGLGYCLNKGFEQASHDMIAYLPADDIYYKDHLQKLVETLVTTGSTVAFSGVLHKFNHQFKGSGSYGNRSFGVIDGYPLQLVQVLHRKTEERWMEREELVTDDLDRMFWKKLLAHNRNVVGTREVTCEWVDHASQRHKIINDRTGGGIYLFKRTYGISKPIRFQSSVGNYIDEIEHFENFRQPIVKSDDQCLKILLVGELAFNPERICALEERGHKLYGLWIPDPLNFNTIGPLPFGNVEDIPLENWKQRVDEIKPDIIYSLLNYHAVPLAHHVLTHNSDIPFVWHLKESPFYCRQFGTWNQLISLCSESDGQIYTNEMVRDWFQQFLMDDHQPVHVLDGDLPKKDWFTSNRSSLLYGQDGEIHTVVAGRPMGLFPDDIRQLANQKIHLHLYGNIFQTQFKEMIEKATAVAPNYVHLHPNCPQEDWVKEFSQYDAGWLHFFQSQNQGELLRASWNDLNFPARMATYAAAGLPMLMRDNTGHRVACQEFLEKENLTLLFTSFRDVGNLFADQETVQRVRQNVWNNRHQFAFDTHVDDLIAFFRKVIQNKAEKKINGEDQAHELLTENTI